MRVTTQDGHPCFVAESTGPVAVYLDNDSLIELASGSSGLRERFLRALTSVGTLLFSTTNAVEVGGPSGRCSAALSKFLEQVGTNWIPLEMNPELVIGRERVSEPNAAVSLSFMEAYFQQRAFEVAPEGRIVDLSAQRFFSLGAVVEWSRNYRGRARVRSAEIDEALNERIRHLREDFEADPSSLDRQLPPIAFRPQMPAAFVHTHLLRTLVLEAKAFQFKRNDGLDFCHAVVAVAYGSLATLDKQWKRRVQTLPQPNECALVYYRPELELMVSRLEALADQALPRRFA